MKNNLYFNVILAIIPVWLFFSCKGSRGDYSRENIEDEETTSVDSTLNPEEYLGKLLFFEKEL